MTPIERVLDLARWAPSGDNTQPWRFQILSPTEAVIHTFDTRRHCVYDLTGGPSQIAVGALLETARIAATAQRMRAEVGRLPSETEEKLQFRLQLIPDSTIQPSPLVAFIERRCTQRRPFSRRSLTSAEKAALESSAGANHRLIWFEGPKRWDMARLLFESSKIRLTIPEAYAVHRDIIEWHTTVSETKVPDQAVGLGPLALALMRWAMKSWERTRILSTYFGGTLLPRLQLDLWPGLSCAAHVLVCAQKPARGVDDFVRAGAAVQRLWLTAEELNLRHQPEMTPLIFAGYSRESRAFTAAHHALARASDLRSKLEGVVGKENARHAVWLGRIGAGARPKARSVRLPLDRLLLQCNRANVPGAPP